MQKKIKIDGYEDEYAEAKLCQDIILMLISKSNFSNNITIKGGVVMRSLSNNVRRATIDIDFDFIKYSISDESIRLFINDLNGIMGLKITIIGKPEELRHQDYNGKRIYINIEDKYENSLRCKIDVGVHKYLNIPQDDYCFTMSFYDEGAKLLINSKEQIFTEKLKSILRFGSLSTRYKDVYDMYYLSSMIDKNALVSVFKTLIFDDENIKEKSIDDIINRLEKTFSNKMYQKGLLSSDKNWINKDNRDVINVIIDFLLSLKNISCE